MGMLKKLLFTLGIVLLGSTIFAQSGTLQGKITEADGKTTIPFANVIIESGGKQFGGATSDFDGKYTIRPIPPGKYTVKATFVGFKTVQVNDVVIKPDQITFVNMTMEATSKTLEEVVITTYKIPLVDKGKTTGGETMGSDDLKNMSARSAQAMAATVGGVFSQDGEMGSVRGQRTDGTVIYIDGVRVRGSSGVPKSAIDQISVMMGGLPARYGEATGGVLNITTKGPSRDFGGNIEIVGSVDGYNNFIGAFSLNGPLIKSKDPKDPTSILGYFISGEISYAKDNYPARGGTYRAKQSYIDKLIQNPLIPIGEGNAHYYAADFTTKGDLQLIRARENAESYGANFAGKIDVKTNKNTNLTFGGSFDYNNYRDWGFASSLFNSAKNGINEGTTWRAYGRFSQKFANDTGKTLIKDVFYQLQVDYTQTYGKSYDKDHKDNLFNYGYIGKFKTYKSPYYEKGDVTINGIDYKDIWKLTNFYDTLVTYERSELNPELANWTTYYYDRFSSFSNSHDYYRNKVLLQNGFALLNGDQPNSIYGLFVVPGAITSSYSKSEANQIGINASGSATIGNHALEFGFQYEQRSDRAYGLAPTGLWTLMRELTNFHINQLDLTNPQPVFVDDGFGQWVFMDTVNYFRSYDAESQRFFDTQVRKKLGLNPNGTDWVDVDNLDPSFYNINMFSADELLNGGFSYVSYYGYDHLGNKTKSQASLEDFFENKDENGNYKRSIGAFQPIYMGAYIQDQFSFEDLIFNVGVRVDRFDANQKVLKDNYLLSPAKTVAEATIFDHPSNMGSDYVVYVDDARDPSKILGYRNGSVWYNSYGQEITDPNVLSSGTTTGRVTPWVLDPDATVKVSTKAFKDYEPQLSFMPRIAFSFPISDKALFFAHYDVITKRPTSGLRMNPVDYLYIEKAGTNFISNPSLRPEKTVDYELGFQQALNAKSALKISGYYSEVRDLVQAYRFTEAYPNTYYSYNNIDFGTIMGMTLSYDLRQTENIRLRANYTLQFAKGTGSDATSARSLVTSGQPNLRTLNSLAYDQRHAVKANIDYRFGFGKDYNGPKTSKVTKDNKAKVINWLENTGINITFNGGSGIPYTRSSTPYSITGIGTRIISGSMYGSNLPWQFWIDARIDRSFIIKLKDNEDPKKQKMGFLNFYVEALNIFNFKNVKSVYSYTGNAEDDGFLSAAEFQQTITQQVSPTAFYDLYSTMVANPYNYSLPRRINVGVMFMF